MKVKGFSHVTINVKDLDKSLDFYRGILSLSLIHKGKTDAYLEWGNAWICLIQREGYCEVVGDRYGTDHIAFWIDEEEFDEAVRILIENNVQIVRGPVSRGSGRSINFLDPDQTELELHTSTLHERMKVWD